MERGYPTCGPLTKSVCFKHLYEAEEVWGLRTIINLKGLKQILEENPFQSGAYYDNIANHKTEHVYDIS